MAGPAIPFPFVHHVATIIAQWLYISTKQEQKSKIDALASSFNLMHMRQAMDYADYLEPRFTFRQASEGAAFPLNTLRSNYQRGWFESFGNGLSGGRGRAQKLCLGDVLTLAIASRLIEIGFGPQRAFNTARVFGLVANTPKGLPRRKPFELFDRKRFDTVLIWTLEAPPRAAAVPKAGAISLEELRLDRDFGDATVILLLNPIEKEVFRSLGLPAIEEPTRD